MSEQKYTRETVLNVRSWVPGKLLSLTTTRSPQYEFTAGQFARLGLPESNNDAQPPTIWRAYSMVNAPHQRDFLEFYSIVVPEGDFSPRLAQLQPGDPIYIDKTAFGFLTLDRFSAGGDPSAGDPAGGDPSAGVPAGGVPAGGTPTADNQPGGDLWLIATGTGLSAYLSILQDPATWAAYQNIILVHGVRTVEELTYRETISQWCQAGLVDSALTPQAKLTYLPVPTREPYLDMPQARLTQLIEDGRLETLANRRLDPQQSKIMLCGNPDMLTEARQLLKVRDFAVGRRGNPGNLALENYW